MTDRWYSVAVHARQEKAAAGELARRGFEVFLPVYRERRMWSDRIQPVDLALFPGYLFVRTGLDAERRVELMRVRQVYDLVGRLHGDARIARAIPDVEIDSVRILLRAERALDPVERLVRGTPVVIGAGPLKGVHGLVEEGPDRRRRLIVQIALLGRGVRTELDADDVVGG